MIGLGIFSIATRETVLSGTAREAQYAFYAADAGVECALYEQSLPGAGVLAAAGNGGPLSSCGEIPVTVSGTANPLNPFVFDALIDPVRMTCVHVTVFDYGNYRRIVSQGYNICTKDGKPAKSPILVERDLDILFGLGGDIKIDGTPQSVKNPYGLPTGVLSGVTPVDTTGVPNDIPQGGIDQTVKNPGGNGTLGGFSIDPNAAPDTTTSEVPNTTPTGILDTSTGIPPDAFTQTAKQTPTPSF
jgi:hypothetical protein